MKKLVSLLLAVVMVMSIFAIVPVTASAADTNTVYLINSANWSNVHAYAWNNSVFAENSAWPGQAMQSAGTHSSGAQMYSITFSSPYEKIIFNDGGSTQTADLDYQGGMGYDNSTNSWVSVDPNPTPTPTPTPGGDCTVYFQNNWMWTDVNVYYWLADGSENAAWPGTPAQVYGNDGVYDVYSVDLPSNVLGVIFNGNDGGTGSRNQTPDITGAANGNCYYMIWDDSQGKNTVGIEDINNVIPNPNPTTVEPTQAPVTQAPVTQAPVTQAPVTQAPVTQAPTVEPTEDDVDGLFVRIDGKEYAVTKGETYTYQFCVSVPDVKISGIDCVTKFDTDGLDFVPYMLDGEEDLDKHFPKLSGVINNFDIDGELYYNYSNYRGVSLTNNAVVFEGQFKVTADKGVYDITTKIETMADTNLNKIVYDGEKVGNYTQSYNFSAEEEPNPTTVEPTVEPTIEPTEKATTATPTTVVNPTTSTNKVYIKIDGVTYEVNKDDVVTYQFTLSVDSTRKISSLDAQTFYDTEGLDFVPYMLDGEEDLDKHFPKLAGVINNFDIDGEIYYNYSNYRGVKLADNAVVFEGQFKVTADKGTYEINTKIVTMADTNMTALVYDYEKLEEFGSTSGLVGYVAPTDGPTQAQPTQAQPTQAQPTQAQPTQAQPTQAQPTQVQPTQSGGNLFVNIDGTRYAVSKGDVLTYQYIIDVPGVKISSFDACTYYDSEGIDFIPYILDGEEDLDKHFPKFSGVVNNFDIDGELYYNYSNYRGVKLENAVVFECQFKVTADSGVYNITTRLRTMADTSMNRYVYDYEKLMDFTNESKLVGYIEPTVPTQPTQPTEAPTYPEGLFVKLGKSLYVVEQGKEYTFTYYLQVEDKLVGSLDARVAYDTKGLEFVPLLDKEGEEDSVAMFPILKAPVTNNKDGMIYFNYTSPTGVKFHTQESVLFTCKFKVTASEGVYEIAPEIFCLADENLGIIVDEGIVCGEYWEKAVFGAEIWPGPGPTDEIVIGDVNFDGKINVFDVTAIQCYAAEYEEFNDKQMIAADTNFDGKVNIFDATEIQYYIAGYITEFVKK